jgi:hypothetical protein
MKVKIIWGIILILALCVVGIFVLDKIDDKKMAQELKEKLQDQKVQQKVIDKENAIVDEMVSNLDSKGIVFWGDESLTGEEYSNFPNVFREQAVEELYGNIENLLTEKTMTVEHAEELLSVQNMGVKGEGFYEIMTRSGARQLVTAEDYTIDADTKKSNIELEDDHGHSIRYVKQPFAEFGTVTIAGVEGQLDEGSGKYDTGQKKTAFVRDKAGEEVAVKAGTPVELSSATEYRKWIPVVFVDENIEEKTDKLIEHIKEVLANNKEAPKRYLVIVRTEPEGKVDQRLSEEFSDHYLVCSVPPADMSDKDLEDLADKAYQILDSQECFDDIKATTEEAEMKLSELAAQ